MCDHNCGMCGGLGDCARPENHRVGCPHGDALDLVAALMADANDRRRNLTLSENQTRGPVFHEWPKIGRLNRDIVITEKIDGTNAAIGVIPEVQHLAGPGGGCEDVPTGKFRVYAQSRSRIITPEDDNMGFARWVHRHADVLIRTLGEGLHFGEWWGCGIQRGYDLSERRFSLFNTAKWEANPDGKAALSEARTHGVAIYAVPVLYTGPWVGNYGYIDSKTGNFLEAPQDWPDFDEAYQARERAIEEFIQTSGLGNPDYEKYRGMLRALAAPVNPRPRFAPNFILEWLKRSGSHASPGYMNPEGICVFHKASGVIFKATVEKDEKHKFEQ